MSSLFMRLKILGTHTKPMSQKFTAGVTNFWPCDEIRRFDGRGLETIKRGDGKI
jgi:hypothetical protein